MLAEQIFSPIENRKGNVMFLLPAGASHIDGKAHDWIAILKKHRDMGEY